MDHEDSVILSVIAGLAIVCLFLMFFMAMAFAHEWYPKDCCSDHDCFPVPCEQIHSDGDKWEYSLRLIDKSKAQVSPDGACHICANPTHGIICIFLGGMS